MEKKRKIIYVNQDEESVEAYSKEDCEEFGRKDMEGYETEYDVYEYKGTVVMTKVIAITFTPKKKK